MSVVEKLDTFTRNIWIEFYSFNMVRLKGLALIESRMLKLLKLVFCQALYISRLFEGEILVKYLGLQYFVESMNLIYL